MKINRILHIIVAILCLLVCAAVAHSAAPPRPTGTSAKVMRNDQDRRGQPQLSEQEQEEFKKLFNKGYKAFSKKKYRRSAEIFYDFITQLTPDNEDYEWAEFFFGISLKNLGYSHAAVDIMAHLVTRKPNPKIVAYCLEIFEEITRSMPFDRELIIKKVLSDQDYGFVDAEVADFINYHQGVYDWENGLYQWGDEHFEKIRPGTYYFYKYFYMQALYKVYQGRTDDAVDILNQIIQQPDAPVELQDTAKKTLARLLYEKKAYENADFIYDRIERSVMEQSEILLERAWAHYRLGNAEKAMGLLYSFEAPSFETAFRPEYFILKSLIYRDVCHYNKAMRVVHEFHNRYGEALEIIKERGAAEDNGPLMTVLLHKEKVNTIFRFLNQLESERNSCAAIGHEPLRKYLEKLYDLKIEENTISLRQLITAEYEKIADELLGYEEVANLMEYEIGLDMYQRVYQYHFSEEEQEKADSAQEAVAVYDFQGEFWNDELLTYQVVLPNKCKNMEEWDIFFK